MHPHLRRPSRIAPVAYRRDSAITAAALRGSFTRLPFYAPEWGRTCACYLIHFIVLSYLLFACLSSHAYKVPFSLEPCAVTATQSGPGRTVRSLPALLPVLPLQQAACPKGREIVSHDADLFQDVFLNKVNGRFPTALTPASRDRRGKTVRAGNRRL